MKLEEAKAKVDTITLTNDVLDSIWQVLGREPVIIRYSQEEQDLLDRDLFNAIISAIERRRP